MPASKRPDNTAFKQQRLKSWQPLLTPKGVIPIFFVIAVLFIPIGIVLQVASDQVNQITLDYTKCNISAPVGTFAKPTESGSNIREWRYDPVSRNCTIRFDIPEQKIFKGPVYLYYRLTAFYQNNRLYVKSYDLKQLAGDPVLAIDSGCSPLTTAGGKAQPFVRIDTNETVSIAEDAVFYPCGLIANSFFSDIISDLRGNNSESQPILLIWDRSDIAWPGDKSKFGRTRYADIFPDNNTFTRTIIPPPFWREAFPKWKDGYTKENIPDLSNWPEFQVWFRTAGLPTFRKLVGLYPDGLPLNTQKFELTVTINFDVSKFGGTKSLVLSSSSALLGGKNQFLGTIYLVCGVGCLFVGVGFLLQNFLNPRKLGDHTLLVWNSEPVKREEQNALLNQE